MHYAVLSSDKAVQRMIKKTPQKTKIFDLTSIISLFFFSLLEMPQAKSFPSQLKSFINPYALL